MAWLAFRRFYRDLKIRTCGTRGCRRAYDLQALEGRVLLSAVPSPVINGPLTGQALVTGTGPGQSAQVRVLDASQNVLQDYYPFETFTGGIAVATGDVNGDGTPDVVVAAQNGGSSNIRVFSGVDGQPLAGSLGSFLAFAGPSSDVPADQANPQSAYYTQAFQGKISLAVGDINGDGHADIIVAVGADGPPHVEVFSGADGSVLMSTLAYPGSVTDPSDPNYFADSFHGGVSVAAGDVSGSGYDDIIVAPGAGMAPTVKVFDGQSHALVDSFNAYDPAYLGGVNVAAGDYNGDGLADIITAPQAGVAPNVKVLNAADGSTLASFWAYDQSYIGGVSVASGDSSGNGQADIITAPGAGITSNVVIFQGDSGYAPTTLSSFIVNSGDTSGLAIAAPAAAPAWNTLYASFYNDNMIKKFDSQGVGTQFNTGGTVSLPYSLAFDQAGNLYISNAGNNTIQKLDSSGVATQFNVSGAIGYPSGLAFDSAGNLYMADPGNNTIMKFDSSGVGTQFNVSGTLNLPEDLAFDSSGNLYVANYGNDTIMKFDSSGVGTQFNVSGTLDSPDGLAFDKAGNLYVSNVGNNTIMKFDSSGVGTQFNVSGALNDPVGLAFDRAGNLYVAEFFGNDIMKFDANGAGTSLNALGTGGTGASDVAFGPARA